MRLGNSGTAILYIAIHVAALAAILHLTGTDQLPLLAPLVPAGLMLLAFKAGAAIRVGIDDREGMTRAIEATLAIHTIGGLWLTAVAVYLFVTAA